MQQLKTIIRAIIISIPIVSDYYRYYWSFSKSITACRGVYSTFAQALQAIPPGAKGGYSQPEILNHASVAKLTSGWEADVFKPSDYPVVFWLGSAFAQGSKTVFDLGGNVGHAYYTYKKFLQYPLSLRWIICEIPEVVTAGIELASKGDNPGLSFTEAFTDADGADILLTSGTLQYIETSLAQMLGKLKIKPKHITIDQVPFYDGKTYITLQNIGYTICPYKIQNRTEFIDSLIAIGYELVDTWKLDRLCTIPFHSKKNVSNYWGFYLKLTD